MQYVLMNQKHFSVPLYKLDIFWFLFENLTLKLVSVTVALKCLGLFFLGGEIPLNYTDILTDRA